MDVQGFRLELEKFMDNESVNFVSYPVDVTEANGKFSDALIYLMGTVTPPINSSVLAGAKTAYMGIMSGLIFPTAPVTFSTAMTAFASAVIPGFLPLFVATPPPVPISVLPVVSVGSSLNNSQILDIFVPIVVSWFSTGLAINSQGVTINWS